MADVFISYKREEREAVGRLAGAFQQLGLIVWFDASMTAGEAFSDEIDREARSANVILVCWSPSSRESRWVKSEALIGFERDTLAACYVAGPDGFAPPAPFNSVHAEDLRTWLSAPSDTHAGWRSLLRRIGKLCGRADLASWGALDAQASANSLRKWLSAHPDSPLFVTVEALLRAREQQDSARERLERAARERHEREEAERKARDAAERQREIAASARHAPAYEPAYVSNEIKSPSRFSWTLTAVALLSVVLVFVLWPRDRAPSVESQAVDSPATGAAQSVEPAAQETQSPATATMPSASPPSPAWTSSTPYDFALLRDPNVLRANEAAKAAQATALQAAQSGRTAASRGEAAAARARNRELDTIIYDLGGGWRYEGDGGANAIVGFGVFTRTDPSGNVVGRYAGEANGTATGYGVITYGRGSRIEGQFSSGKAQGYAVQHHHDGAIYYGQMNDNNRAGVGVYTMPTVSYWGEWRDDFHHGYGAQWNYDGRALVDAGRYERGLFIDGENNPTFQ